MLFYGVNVGVIVTFYFFRIARMFLGFQYSKRQKMMLRNDTTTEAAAASLKNAIN
jgi:hypothetical protein